MKKYIAEFIGTFFLVFCGCALNIVNDITNGSLGMSGLCIGWGAIIMIMIYSLGNVSGAHMNPAVSIAFFVLKKLSIKDLGGYIAAQFSGAFVGSSLLLMLFIDHPNLGSALPAEGVTIPMTFVFEVMASFLLMFVILNVSQRHKNQLTVTAIAVGATVAVDVLFAGPMTGASMNPARSLGPAFTSGIIEGQWVYVLAPMVGACLAIPFFQLLNAESE